MNFDNACRRPCDEGAYFCLCDVVPCSGGAQIRLCDVR